MTDIVIGTDHVVNDYVIPKKIQDFLVFATGQFTMGDDEPHVRLLKAFADRHQLDTERRLWLGILYLAYYQDGSANIAWHVPGVPERQVLPPLDLPISYQRRNLYGGRIERHLREWMMVPSLTKMLDVDTWGDLLETLKTVYGNGRWAAFTTGELLVKLANLRCKPNTFEIFGSSGPKEGLGYLDIAGTEEGAQWIAEQIREDNPTAPDEQIESFLCNWSRMCKADFYLGHNFDRQFTRIKIVEEHVGKRLDELWELRSQVFEHRVLGELTGWDGVNKDRKKIYANEGIVLQPWERR